VPTIEERVCEDQDRFLDEILGADASQQRSTMRDSCERGG